MFQGALERAPDPEHDGELRELVSSGRPIRDALRDLVHGTIDRDQFDRETGRAWLERANEQRGRLAMDAARSDYAGWSGHDQAELVLTGSRATAEIVAVEDTGMTVNDDPRVNIRLRVEPEAGEPFEIERKVLVSKVAIPRRGERVDVAYDPEEPSNFTFRLSDLADDPVGGTSDPIDQLAKLGELVDKGLLTREEFEREKQRLLGPA
jgi:hypothetical protein